MRNTDSMTVFQTDPVETDKLMKPFFRQPGFESRLCEELQCATGGQSTETGCPWQLCPANRGRVHTLTVDLLVDDNFFSLAGFQFDESEYRRGTHSIPPSSVLDDVGSKVLGG
jgi:hypothetical protein